MRTKGNRVLALLLSVVMFAAYQPVWVRAESDEPEEEPGWIAPQFAPRFSPKTEQKRSRSHLRAELLPSAYGFAMDENDSLTINGQTPVRDQGTNGVCWAFATMAAMEANMLRSELGGEDPDLSETHMIYATSQYGSSAHEISNAEQGYDTRPTDGGNLYYAASYLMRGTTLGGTLQEANDPYLYENETMPYRSVDITKERGVKRAYTVRNIPIITGDRSAGGMHGHRGCLSVRADAFGERGAGYARRAGKVAPYQPGRLHGSDGRQGVHFVGELHSVVVGTQCRDTVTYILAQRIVP